MAQASTSQGPSAPRQRTWTHIGLWNGQYKWPLIKREEYVIPSCLDTKKTGKNMPGSTADIDEIHAALIEQERQVGTGMFCVPASRWLSASTLAEILADSDGADDPTLFGHVAQVYNDLCQLSPAPTKGLQPGVLPSLPHFGFVFCQQFLQFEGEAGGNFHTTLLVLQFAPRSTGTGTPPAPPVLVAAQYYDPLMESPVGQEREMLATPVLQLLESFQKPPGNKSFCILQARRHVTFVTNVSLHCTKRDS